MTIYYSPSTGGFYDTDIHTVIPEDAIQTTHEERDALINQQSNLKRVGITSDGAVGFVDIVAPVKTADELAEAARSCRDALITKTDHLLMPDYPISADSLVAVKVYRQLLRDITAQAEFPSVIDWPEMPEIVLV